MSEWKCKFLHENLENNWRHGKLGNRCRVTKLLNNYGIWGKPNVVKMFKFSLWCQNVDLIRYWLSLKLWSLIWPIKHLNATPVFLSLIRTPNEVSFKIQMESFSIGSFRTLNTNTKLWSFIWSNRIYDILFRCCILLTSDCKLQAQSQSYF